MSEISFKELPLYSYDYDADFPPAGKAFKAAIAAVDAVLFVTPEYNRSIPGGLKNAIDGRAARMARTHSRESRRLSLAPRQARSPPRSPSRACAVCSVSATHLR